MQSGSGRASDVMQSVSRSASDVMQSVSRSASDVMQSGSASDVMQSGSASDVMQSGSASDVMQSGSASDVMQSGSASDVMQSGSASDMERFLEITFSSFLERKNEVARIEYDSTLEFDEDTHKYGIRTADGKEIKVHASVSQVVKYFFPSADFREICTKMVKKAGFRRSLKYRHEFRPLLVPPLTDEIEDEDLIKLILQRWKEGGAEAARKGTVLHKYAELVCNGVEVPFPLPSVEYKYVRNYLEYKAREGWRPFRTEWRIFHIPSPPLLPIAGTIDLVMSREVDGKRDYLIADWKRCVKIVERNYFSKAYGKYPCNKFSDCNYSHYTLQLFMYKTILELAYNIKVEGGLFLVTVHPNYNDFEEKEIIATGARGVVESMWLEMSSG